MLFKKLLFKIVIEAPSTSALVGLVVSKMVIAPFDSVLSNVFPVTVILSVETPSTSDVITKAP